MVKYTLHFFLLSLLGVLSSCEVIEPSVVLDYPGDQIVLNGFIARNRIEVFVGRSQDPNGDLSFTGADTLPNALVALVDATDSVWYQIPYVEKGNYVLDMVSSLPLNTPFRLVANAAELPEARSQPITIPELQIDISASLTAVEESDNGDWSTIIYVEVSLTDNNPTTDFFHFYPTNRYRIPFDLSRLLFRDPAADSRSRISINTDESFDQQCSLQFLDGGFILPDFCFSNENLSFPLLILLPASEAQEDSIGFTIATTSDFLHESARSLDQPGDALDKLLFRPSLYLSNVENGYGVVAPRHEQLVWVEQ